MRLHPSNQQSDPKIKMHIISALQKYFSTKLLFLHVFFKLHKNETLSKILTIKAYNMKKRKASFDARYFTKIIIFQKKKS